MVLVTKYSVFADYLTTQLKDQAASLGLDSVIYGDQDKLPPGVVVCIEPNRKSIELNGVPRKTLITIDILIMVYIGFIQLADDNRKDVDSKIEAIEDYLNGLNTMGGTAIHSFVTAIESGFATKNGTLVRASRMTFSITTQKVLGN